MSDQTFSRKEQPCGRGTNLEPVAKVEARRFPPSPQLVVAEAGPALDLRDAEGNPRAQLGAGSAVTPDGTTTTYPESSLRLFGPDGNLIWSAPR